MKRRITQGGEADPQPVAGNGLLDRRLFLKSGLVFGTAVILEQTLSRAIAGENDNKGTAAFNPASPPWMHTPGAPFSIYGMPSRYEDTVVRFPTANRDVPGNGVSWTPLHKLEGMITPNGLHFERHHNGVPDIDPDAHRLLIHGAVDQ